MAKPSAAASATLDFSRIVSHTELAEGSSFGPTSFRGTIIDAGYAPHRFMSDPPKPDQNPAYTLNLWAKFRVHEVLDSESGWDPDEHDGIYEHHWKLGSKSLQHLFATNDTRTPAGISGGFDELALMAAGKTDKGGIVTFTDPIEDTRGRWFMAQPGTPESKGKLESKSGYSVFLRESVPAIEAVDPSLILTFQDKKGEDVKTLDVLGNDPEDGYPMGAKFFIGLSGIWDTKKISLSIKDKGTGREATVDQRVLYITSFDGRVDVGEEGEVQAGAAPATKKTSKAAGKAAPAAASPASPAPEPDGGASAAALGNGASPMDEVILKLILETLPIKGHVAMGILGKAVGPKLTQNFQPAELPAAVAAYTKLIKAAPDKTGARGLADMGMGDSILFTFDPKSQLVERWQAQAA